MAKISLSKEQLLELDNTEKQLKQAQLIKRVQSIKLRNKGMTNIEIGKFLLLSDQTISNWAQIYLTKGLDALLQWNYEGKTSILTIEQQEELKTRNSEKPFEKASEAQDYIKQNFGIDFHLHWVQKLMKKNFILHSRRHA
jgi:transposase